MLPTPIELLVIDTEGDGMLFGDCPDGVARLSYSLSAKWAKVVLVP